MDDYEKKLLADLNDARERVRQGVAAANFMKTDEGRLIQEWINEQISYSMERMTGKNPLDDRGYLEEHGAVRVLKDFNVMLNTKEQIGVAAQEEVKVLDEQRKSMASENA